MNKFIKLTNKNREVVINIDEIACIVKDEENRLAEIALRHDTLHVSGVVYSGKIAITLADYEKIIKTLGFTEN